MFIIICMVIRTFAELTWVLMHHVPVAYKAYIDGALKSTTSWVGSGPFFFFSPNHNEIASRVTYGDSAKIYDNTWKMPGTFPNYKEFFGKSIETNYTKPVVVINNKYIEEWNGPPVNYLDVNVLDSMIGILYDSYEIIYIRSRSNERGYWNDNQPARSLGDYEMIRSKYPNVRCLSDIIEGVDISYNDMQLRMHSIADKFISVAGGNAVVSSCFGGTNLIYRCSESKRSNGRQIWHEGSHLSQLSGATILGANCYSDLINNVKNWVI